MMNFTSFLFFIQFANSKKFVIFVFCVGKYISDKETFSILILFALLYHQYKQSRNSNFCTIAWIYNRMADDSNASVTIDFDCFRFLASERYER